MVQGRIYWIRIRFEGKPYACYLWSTLVWPFSRPLSSASMPSYRRSSAREIKRQVNAGSGSTLLEQLCQFIGFWFRSNLNVDSRSVFKVLCLFLLCAAEEMLMQNVTVTSYTEMIPQSFVLSTENDDPYKPCNSSSCTYNPIQVDVLRTRQPILMKGSNFHIRKGSSSHDFVILEQSLMVLIIDSCTIILASRSLGTFVSYRRSCSRSVEDYEQHTEYPISGGRRGR